MISGQLIIPGTVLRYIKQVDKVTDRVIKLHRLRLPHCIQKGGYRQVISFDAFRRCGAYEKHPLYYFFVKDEVEYNIDKANWEKAAKRCNIPIILDPEPIDYKSLWDFYKAIGWDYKKKRFTISTTARLKP